MSRQQAAPVWIGADGYRVALSPVPLASRDIPELNIQQIVFDHPSTLPISDIDGQFADAVPICMELNTVSGPVDVLLVTPTGLPVIVECKLWRNAEARREVVGQIIDYAKEFARWSAADLDGEVARRCGGKSTIEVIRQAGHQVDEIAFTDELTRNLRRGRFLLLIVGDGIREGVEVIAEYMQAHSGMRFTLGLVEMSAFRAPDGGLLFAPRTMARTVAITREVILLPDNAAIRDEAAQIRDRDERAEVEDQRRRRFVTELLSRPLLLDPDQPPPTPTPKGYLYVYMPAPASSCWVSLLLKEAQGRVGVRLNSNIGSVGDAAIRAVIEREGIEAVKTRLGGSADVRPDPGGRFVIEDIMAVGDFYSEPARSQAIAWLRERLSTFIGAFRPLIREAVSNLGEQA